MSRKTGLILCRNPDFSVLDLPQDVNWIYGSSNNPNIKYDYVANFNCSNELVQQFLDDPTLYLKPNGAYLHLGGVNSALDKLGITLNSYYQLTSTVKQKITDYFKTLTKELGFSRWYIPPNGRVLSEDVYFYSPQSRSPQLLQLEQPIFAQGLESLHDDYIYEIARQLNYSSLMRLCSSSRRLNNLCRTERFRTLPVEAWLREYSSPEQALIEASRRGNINIVQQLLQRGVSPRAKNGQAIMGAIFTHRLPILKLFLRDPTVTSDSNLIHSAMVTAVKSGNIDSIKLLLPYAYKDQNIFNFSNIMLLLETAEYINNSEINNILLTDPAINAVNQVHNII